MKHFIILFFIFQILEISGQESSFIVRLKKDTLLVGNVLKIEFEMNNINGVFTPPDFMGFSIISGPNTSTSFSVINGKVTQKATYSYVLSAKNPGIFTLGPGIAKTDQRQYLTNEISIVVLENPDGLIEDQNSFRKMLEFKSDTQDSLPSKPKRKLKKI